jgi:hypothetical protein
MALFFTRVQIQVFLFHTTLVHCRIHSSFSIQLSLISSTTKDSCHSPELRLSLDPQQQQCNNYCVWPMHFYMSVDVSRSAAMIHRFPHVSLSSDSTPEYFRTCYCARAREGGGKQSIRVTSRLHTPQYCTELWNCILIYNCRNWMF